MPPQPPIADIDPDAVAPDKEATRALVRKLMTENMELRNEMRELRLGHKQHLKEMELDLLREMRKSAAAAAAVADAAAAAAAAEIDSDSDSEIEAEMDRLSARSPLDTWLESYAKANWERLIQALDLGLIPPNMWPQKDKEEYEANKFRLWLEGHRLAEECGVGFLY